MSVDESLEDFKGDTQQGYGIITLWGEYELQEDGVQSQGFSWLQASEGSSKLLQPKGFRDTVTLRCWDLPQVGKLLVDQPGGLAIPSLVCPVLHKLQDDGVCRDGALVKGASRPAS